MDLNNKDEIHEWLNGLRRLKRISYKEIGSVIGYSDTGISKALDNKTLSAIQINAIIEKFGLLEEFEKKFSVNNNLFLNETGEDYIVLPKRLGEYLFKNHDKLMATDTSYEMFIKKIAAEEGLKMVKDLLPKNK